jgi:hypothetical protein
MHHYWLVYDRDGATEIFIQPAHALTFAQIKAALAGQQGKLRESHELTPRLQRGCPLRQSAERSRLQRPGSC